MNEPNRETRRPEEARVRCDLLDRLLDAIDAHRQSYPSGSANKAGWKRANGELNQGRSALSVEPE